MNILILNWKDIKNPEVGGAEIILYECVKRWIKEGHNVTWFSRTFKGAPKTDFIGGIEIVRRGNRLTTYPHAYNYYRSLKVKPDIVLDALNTVFWQTPLYVEKKKRIAYVNQLAKEVLFHELPPILSHIAYFLEKLQFTTYRNTPFICYANSTKLDLIKESIPEKNIEVFPMGLDHKRYEPGKKAKYPLFLCVSRLVRMKRTHLVISAMDIVRKTHPNARLAIVGYGYQRDELGRLRDKLGLKKNVSFVDENILYFEKAKGDHKLELMQKAWALIFPSVKEGWGMTVTECAACGTPAIVSDVTGVRDSVVDGKTGLILSKDPTSQEVADAIIALIEKATLRKRLSSNAILFAKQFTWEKSASSVLSLFKKHIHE